jgi:hypothetical protein
VSELYGLKLAPRDGYPSMGKYVKASAGREEPVIVAGS